MLEGVEDFNTEIANLIAIGTAKYHENQLSCISYG